MASMAGAVVGAVLGAAALAWDGIVGVMGVALAWRLVGWQESSGDR